MPDLWLKFYPKDWNGDHQLRSCSLAARGLWAAFLEPMHAAIPYGHLLINGQKPSMEQLAGVASCKAREVDYCLKELIKQGVASVTEDGVVFSRRMVRDGERRTKRGFNGRLGGNPKLKPEVNQILNQKVNQEVKGLVGPMVSGTLASGLSASLPKKNEVHDEPLDEAWARMLSAYPQSRRQEGRIVQDGFIAACRSVGVEGVFARLVAHKRSVEWRKGFIPNMLAYFGEAQKWKQELPDTEPTATKTGPTMEEILAETKARKASYGR